MTVLDRFLQRVRGWQRALQYGLSIADGARIKVVFVLELKISDDDREDLRHALPGWRVGPTTDDDWARLSPPSYLGSGL